MHLNKRSDPYEFEDDMTAPAVSMEGFKRTNSVKVCVVINKHACTKQTLCTFLGYKNYMLITVHVSERIIHESPIMFYTEFYTNSLKMFSYMHSFLVIQKTVLYMLRIKLV